MKLILHKKKILSFILLVAVVYNIHKIFSNEEKRKNILSIWNNIGFQRHYVLDGFQDDYDATTILRYAAANQEKENNILERPCPKYPPNLLGNVTKYIPHATHPPRWSKILDANPTISTGGRYSPRNCKARYRVAIIIPLRGREIQLRGLLSHMHPVWQRQQLDYTVYVVTQSGDELFNRGKLLNVGFAEARKDRKYDCYVFHDVDLLLKNDKCLYHCLHDSARHVSEYFDTLDEIQTSYRLSPCCPYSFLQEEIQIFGGVSMMSQKYMDDVNGFSNLYWGWGGEDDDLFMRLWSTGHPPLSPYGHICSFHMIKHEREKKNVESESRFALLFHTISRMKHEGLNTLRYRVIRYERASLFTNITVDIGKPKKRLQDFMEQTFTTDFDMCIARMPWS